jgi:hypothetical protein
MVDQLLQSLAWQNGSKISSIYHNAVTIQSIIVKLAVDLHKWLAKKKLQ